MKLTKKKITLGVLAAVAAVAVPVATVVSCGKESTKSTQAKKQTTTQRRTDEAQLAALKAELAKTNQERDALQAQKDELNDKIGKTFDIIASFQKQIDDLKAQVLKNGSSKTTTTGTTTTGTTKATGTGVSAAVQTKLDAFQKLIDGLKKNIEDLRQSNTYATRQISKLENSEYTLKGKIKALEGKNSGLEGKVTTLTAEQVTLKKEVDALKAKVAAGKTTTTTTTPGKTTTTTPKTGIAVYDMDYSKVTPVATTYTKGSVADVIIGKLNAAHPTKKFTAVDDKTEMWKKYEKIVDSVPLSSMFKQVVQMGLKQDKNKIMKNVLKISNGEISFIVIESFGTLAVSRPAVDAISSGKLTITQLGATVTVEVIKVADKNGVFIERLAHKGNSTLGDFSVAFDFKEAANAKLNTHVLPASMVDMINSVITDTTKSGK